MNQSKMRGIAILAMLFLILAQSKSDAAGEKDTRDAPLVGSWSLVLVDNVLPDGSRMHLYGPDPQGILTFDAQGRYALQIYRSDRTKFASNDKSKATPEENSGAVQGANSHFGRYRLDPGDHTITFRIDHASFPNWEGTQQKRSFTLVGDRLTYTVPTPTTGGTAIGEDVWKRVP